MVDVGGAVELDEHDAALVATAARLYEAMHRMDAAALVGLLSEDFVGYVSEGLGEIGGTFRGGEAMLREVWLPAAKLYGVLPHPEEFLPSGEDRVVVLGRYKGTPPATGRRFEAAFAHVLRVRDGQLTECRQITDSATWIDAAAPPS